MKCPIDDSPLSVSSREGVEIDFCPQCRGVWLDRGELDKIIERSAQDFAPPPPAPPPIHQPRPGRSDHDRDRDRDYGRHHHGKRRKSFLEELFD